MTEDEKKVIADRVVALLRPLESRDFEDVMYPGPSANLPALWRPPAPGQAVLLLE